MRFSACLIVAVLLFSVLNAQDPGVSYSHESGFYDAPFALTLTASGTYNQIAYTLDGSDPKSSITASIVSSPAIITIDPDDTTRRGHTPGVVVRSALYNGSLFSGPSQCKTYLFTGKVRIQSDPGGEWPDEEYRSVNNHCIDYSMDTEVTENPSYTGLVEPALLEIPSISIVTDLKNFFNSDSGIYVNSFEEGELWERECSFEIINPDNTHEFQVNAGIRIKGGWSRQIFNPKYSLRILFKEKYGPKKLEYAFFGEEGASEFNHIELRTEQNCGWTLDGGIARYNTFLRDIFARDSQRDMNHPYIRSRYYHLYINGMYWGIYMTHERANEDYAESYFGGDEDDYDVIKATELVSGSMDAWKALWTLSNTGFESNSQFFAVTGCDAEGNPVRNSRVHCDLDNLIDYMVLVFYTGNFDGPVSAWSGNVTAANFITLADRTDKSFGFKFLALDFEYAMMVDDVYVGYGLYENRVNIGDPGVENRMNTPNFDQFNPQWLHYKLTRNREYRMRFIDRAYYLLEENGVLTPEESAERMIQRKEKIDTAIVAESARWGDAQQDDGPSLTKADWENEVGSLMDSFFPNRTDILIQQLKDADLYSELKPPVIEVSGRIPATGQYYLSGDEEVTVTNSNGQGTLYYTTNGKDPRAIGDGLAADAIQAGSAVESLSPAHAAFIFARVKNGNDWSPARKLSLLLPASEENYSSLKVTELNYNPPEEVVDGEAIPGSGFEFIEFRNTGSQPLNISGVHLDSAVQYTVPPNTLLMPGEYYVIADKPNYFYHRYGMIPGGNFSGNFSNSGEFVLMEDSSHNKIVSFTYSDSDPWPELADGYGFSMMSVEVNPTGDPAFPEYWKNSPAVYGNPFADTTSIILDIPMEPEELFAVFPNPTSGCLYIIPESQNNSLSSVRIQTMTGIRVYETNFYGELLLNFDALDIPQGVYLVSIRSGQTVSVRKIIYNRQ